jgi:hypothetical protein
MKMEKSKENATEWLPVAEQQQAQENVQLIEKLMAFCIDNWDNEFMHEVQDDPWGKKGHLDAQKELQDHDEGS